MRMRCGSVRLYLASEITLTDFRAISLSSVRRVQARAWMAIVCIVADARTASAADRHLASARFYKGNSLTSTRMFSL
jgi:hypothetical protein